MVVMRTAQRARNNIFNLKNTFTIIPKSFTTKTILTKTPSKTENHKNIEIKKVEGIKKYIHSTKLEKKYLDFIDSHNVDVSNYEIMPLMEFPKEFGPKRFVKHLKKALPVITPFQSVLLGNGIDGKNIMAAGPHGIGKFTCSAVLMLAHIHKNKQNLRPYSPIALVIVKTPFESFVLYQKIIEMSQQIRSFGAHQKHLENFLNGTKTMSEDLEFLVCSPHMIMRAVKMDKLNLDRVSFVIGNDMANFGEESDFRVIGELLSEVNPKKQCVFVADNFSMKSFISFRKALDEPLMMKLQRDSLVSDKIIKSARYFVEDYIFSRLIESVRLSFFEKLNTIVLCDKNYQCEEICKKMEEIGVGNYCVTSHHSPFFFDETNLNNKDNNTLEEKVIVTTDFVMPSIDSKIECLIVYDFKECANDLVQKINRFPSKNLKLVVIIDEENISTIEEMKALGRHQSWNFSPQREMDTKPLKEYISPIDYEAALA